MAKVLVKAAPVGGSLQSRSLWFSNVYRKDLSAGTKRTRVTHGKSLFHKDNKVEEGSRPLGLKDMSNLGGWSFGSPGEDA